jgi:microcin C transport system substrate-binding protein
VIGEPKYAVNFTHFDYVNPAAPKAERSRFPPRELSTTSTASPCAVAAARTESLYDTLFVTSDDEPGSYYPLIAENVRYADNFAWAEISLNPGPVFTMARRLRPATWRSPS